MNLSQAPARLVLLDPRTGSLLETFGSFVWSFINEIFDSFVVLSSRQVEGWSREATLSS